MSNHDRSHSIQDQKQIDKTPRVVGNYAIGKSLGERTFGKVKAGTHLTTGEKVAIKILEKERILESADIQRVTREIKILKMLRHPNIIQLYEIIETSKQLYLIMEYCGGGELFEYIVKNQRLKEKEACKYYQQIIAGIEYINKLGVVHRDLKPENLLLDNDKNIKIVDFGLSNLYKPGEMLKTACGSPCYAAPEMIAGKSYHGVQVDIWSSGIILFACICGYLPFEDPNTATLYKKILSGDLVTPNYISSEAKDFLKCVLNTNPEKRYTIEMIRNHPWYQRAGAEYIPKGLIMGKDALLIDKNVLAQLEEYNINIEHAKTCVEMNKHNNVTTTYYLLLQKHLRNGGKKIGETLAVSNKTEHIEPRKALSVNTNDVQKEFSTTARKREHFEPIGYQSAKPEDSRSLTPQKIESTGGSSSVEQELNLVKNSAGNKATHSLQKRKEKGAPLLLPDSKKTEEKTEIAPVEKPRAFNERSASPWERTRNSAKERDERSEELTTRDSERRSNATKSTTLSSPKNSSPRGRSGIDVKIEKEKEVSYTEEGSRENNTNFKEKNELTGKIRIPLRVTDQKSVGEKESVQSKTHESQFTDAYNFELMHTTRTERLHNSSLRRPATGESNLTERTSSRDSAPPMIEGTTIITKRAFKNVSKPGELKSYDVQIPAIDSMRVTTTESNEVRRQIRQVSAPRGSRAIGSRPNAMRQNSTTGATKLLISNLRDRDFSVYKQAVNPHRHRPPRRTETAETSVDKCRRDGSTNISRLDKTLTSPRDESVDQSRATALQKSNIQSNEPSFYHSMAKDSENTSFIERFSTRRIIIAFCKGLTATAQVKEQTVMPDISQTKNLKITSKQILGDITKSVEISKQYIRESSPLNNKSILLDGNASMRQPPSPQFKTLSNLSDMRDQRSHRAAHSTERPTTHRQQKSLNSARPNASRLEDSASSAIQNQTVLESRVRKYRNSFKRSEDVGFRLSNRENRSPTPDTTTASIKGPQNNPEKKRHFS